MAGHNEPDKVKELHGTPTILTSNQFVAKIDSLQSVKPVENSKLIIRLKEPNYKLDIDMSRLKSPEFKKWLDRKFFF